MKQIECDICSEPIKRRVLGKRLLGKLYCKDCYIKRRHKKRKVLDENYKPVESKPPKIKNEKAKSNNRKLDMYLRKDEMTFLHNKFVKSGLSSMEAKDKVEQIRLHLSKLVEKLREENKSDVEITNEFKEEFAKLCYS